MTTQPPSVCRLDQQAIYDVTPQAIFWRRIQCFAIDPISSEDELDVYLVASFVIGNQVSFDLRHYEGHPDPTVTVYLPSLPLNDGEVNEALDLVIEGLRMPASGIAWRRGEDYEFGSLPRRVDDRLLEREARLLALKIAAECDGFEATTEHIKKRVPELVPLTAKDLEQSKSRRNEKLWQQIVGNVISHKEGRTSLFSQGYAERTADGLRVTDAGLSHLKSVGFLPV